MIKLDGLDSCIIGTCSKCGQVDVFLYSTAKIIQVLMDRDGMSWGEAQEFFDLNIVGLWAGDGTPAFMDPYIEGEVHCGDVVEDVEHNRRADDA